MSFYPKILAKILCPRRGGWSGIIGCVVTYLCDRPGRNPIALNGRCWNSGPMGLGMKPLSLKMENLQMLVLVWGQDNETITRVIMMRKFGMPFGILLIWQRALRSGDLRLMSCGPIITMTCIYLGLTVMSSESLLEAEI